MVVLEFRRQVFQEVDSSNNVVKRALEAGEPEGLVVQARRQTGGYGRQGRGWASPRGGMYLSLLLRPHVPPAQLPTLSLVAGLAVRDAIRGLVCMEEARSIVVKWPNDVVYCEEPVTFFSKAAERFDKAALRKLCGISLESHGGGICVGIGVNVFPAGPAGVLGLPDSVGESPRSAGARCTAGVCDSSATDAESPRLAGNRPLYLAELGFGHTCEQDAAVDAVAEAVLDAFAARYSAWLEEGFAPLVADFSDGDPLCGRWVKMVDVQGRPLVQGVAAGIDEAGNLLLKTEAGLRSIAFGEAHLI